MKRKQNIPAKYSASGFSDWGIKRTIREALNVSRWNPWLAHAWMAEALDQLSLEAPYFTEYDNAVEKINLYWRSLPYYRWYNESDFWSLDGVPQNPVFLPLSSEI